MSWLRDTVGGYANDLHRGVLSSFGVGSATPQQQKRASHALAFSVGPNAGSYLFGQSQGMNRKEAAINAIAPGILTSTAQKMQAGREGEEQVKRERKAEEGRQRRMQGQITGLRESYGIGTTPEAQAAAARLRAWQEQTARAQAGRVTSAAGAGYQQALAQLRARLAQTGQMGGSLDAQQQNALMQQYAQQVAGAQQAGQQSAAQLREQMMRQRLGLEAQIRGNAIDPNALAAARNQLWIYQNQPSAAEIAGGRIAAQGAALYARQRENQARG